MKLSHLYKKYKSTYNKAFYDLSIHTFNLCISFKLLHYFRNSWLSCFTIPLLSLLTVKTFIIFHDCGHQSYTPSIKLNYLIGIITGILCETPLSWSIRHDTHHATNGNIENKYEWRFNENILLTLNDYIKMSNTKKYIIKKILNPQYFYIFIPISYFIIGERFFILKCIFRKTRNKKYILFFILEQLINNVGIILKYYILYCNNILFLYLIAVWFTFNIGVILFHCQHTFNPSYVIGNDAWNYDDSGLKGSSYILIPWYLKYFTGGIEYHHIHHMNSKIPGYNLQKFDEEVKQNSNLFDNVPTLSMKDCYNNLWLTLYDEDAKKYITFEKADKKE